MKKLSFNTKKWLIVSVFILIIVIMFYSVFLDIILRHGLMAMVFAAVAILFYSFVGAFTQKRLLKSILTVCFFIVCFLIYDQTHNKRNHVVHMKENVIYIAPKSDTTRETK
jgi:hypothetical protein